ncbi:MAG: glycosyltransferase family 4 protein [Candidatus Poribacteria bacterium]|nr:glycosyltransferase family 4 protein [Candidatus Poribacteria bacterium]
MFDFPKTLHQLHLFEADGVLYAADIEKVRVVEISTVMADILELAETQTNEEIVQTLKISYIEDDILEAFERFEELGKEGLLFNRGENFTETLALESERRKLLVAIPGISVDSFFDIETLYAGTNMALSYMFQHLTKYVDIHFAGTQNRKLADNVYEVDISVADFGRLSRSINETYFGILTLHRDHETWLLPLYQYTELPPMLVQCHAPRGHGGKALNSMLRHYAAMRDFDAFTAPSDYVREFYADYVWDTSFFNTLPNGVDSALFCPMEKEKAKRELAGEVGDERILTTPTVGYLSRVQSEKGASVYLKLAELNPHLLFLIAGPHFGRYESRELPENLVYAGFHPREKLPLVYNAFDVYCFLSMSGEETFGLTVLEAMACGVPPIVPDFDGVPSVVGDAGLIADADNFDRDIGTLVSYPSPVDFSEKINLLLNDDEMREALSQKARARALSFTWDKTARRIIQFFEELHQKRQLVSPNGLLNVFASEIEASNPEQRHLKYKSILLGMNKHYERSLMGDVLYSQHVEEGLVMTLLKNHTVREAEVLLAGFIEDETEAKAILKRVRGLIQATA